MSAEFQKEAFAQLTKIQLVFLTIIFVGFAADVSLEKSSLDMAREQLASIKDVTLKWNEDWLAEAAAKKVQSLEKAKPQSFKFTAEPNGEMVIVDLPPGGVLIRPLPSALDPLVKGYNPTYFSAQLKPEFSAPQTLSAFWNLWDLLREKIWIYTEFDPVNVSPRLYIRGEQYEGKTFSKVSRVEASDDVSLQSTHRLTGQVLQIHPRDGRSLKEFKPTHTVSARWPLDGRTWSLSFFARGREQIDLSGQDALIAQYGRNNWHLGPASYTFKDLYSISANFADLPLEKIDLILESEAKRYGERFSLLGVSLPTGQLAVWSLLLVTVVYLYFLVVLRGLAHHLQKESEVLAYPWLGILPGKIPLFASLVSLCLFPAAFGVAKCVAIYGLANFPMTIRVWLTAASVVLVLSTVVVAKTILELRRMQK